MLPLHHRDNPSILTRIKEKLQSWLRLVFADKNTRNLFSFLLINFAFAFVELSYGFWSNSLGLISDGFHMLFDCAGLITGLVASVITKKRANERFTYGYVRAEVIAGFINGLSLLVVAMHIMSEAIERAIEPPEIKHERLFIISVAGLMVNLIGIFVFQHGGGHHGHSHGGGGGGGHGHGHSHSQYNNHDHSHNHVDEHHHHHSHDSDISPQNSQIMKGVFLHILADTLGSVGVIISTLLIQWFGWLIADTICSMFIAVLIAISVVPLIKETGVILMQRQPTALDKVLPQCYNKVKQLSGVIGVQEPHFWSLSSEIYVGCLKLEVDARTVEPKYVLAHTQMIFQAAGVRQLTIQLDYVPA
ncbi:zinc transporter 7-A [Leptopilina heterotoma]|uniref:zinc transporter 7-A n=1 Tax=Leptopilina heterotoma TaxID=63436 RepID=UPI001CA7D5EA|nr:zinc transporter 7-A [Leptopilina heterotoma]